MKISNLGQHCGECGLISYCGNPSCYCLCADERFFEVDEYAYERIAENATDIKKLDVCAGCVRGDCEPYRYSETDYADEACEFNDEARDNYCKQVADYVAGIIHRRQIPSQ